MAGVNIIGNYGHEFSVVYRIRLKVWAPSRVSKEHM